MRGGCEEELDSRSNGQKCNKHAIKKYYSAFILCPWLAWPFDIPLERLPLDVDDSFTSSVPTGVDEMP